MFVFEQCKKNRKQHLTFFIQENVSSRSSCCRRIESCHGGRGRFCRKSSAVTFLSFAPFGPSILEPNLLKINIKITFVYLKLPQRSSMSDVKQFLTPSRIIDSFPQERYVLQFIQEPCSNTNILIKKQFQMLSFLLSIV